MDVDFDLSNKPFIIKFHVGWESFILLASGVVSGLLS